MVKLIMDNQIIFWTIMGILGFVFGYYSSTLYYKYKDKKK